MGLMICGMPNELELAATTEQEVSRRSGGEKRSDDSGTRCVLTRGGGRR